MIERSRILRAPIIRFVQRGRYFSLLFPGLPEANSTDEKKPRFWIQSMVSIKCRREIDDWKKKR
jgi:hypothetical protein